MAENQSKSVEVEMVFNAPVSSAIGRNEGSVTINVPKAQPLAEAAAEIQKLLEQLEQINPDASETDQIAYVNAATPMTLKERTVGALKAGGESAFDEFICENKYLKVAKAIIKGWFNPS
jgi:2-succinyl-5-enolpyruvyl-6-hydroxy-3-cyclohexene-1-carboxylate synthase